MMPAHLLPMQRALQSADDPNLLQLGLGLPAPDLFPCEDLADAAQRVLRSPASLQYGPSPARLKGHVVALMRERGVECSEDEVFLTAGAQQGLNLLSCLLSHQRRETAAAGDLVYPSFRQAAAQAVGSLVPVTVDPERGWDIEQLRAIVEQGHRPAFFYMMSSGHNPTGVSMTEAARHALLASARQLSVPIIEDDVYGFLQYGGESVPPLRSLDGKHVFYVGSFSKVLAPALRVGWILAAAEWMPALSRLKEASDIDMGTFAQRVVCAYLDESPLLPRIARLRAAYRARRDALCAALRAHMPATVRWRVPDCGFFVWLESMDGVDTASSLAAAMTRGVTFAPGAVFSLTGDVRHRAAARLSFSHCAIDRFDDAVCALAAVITAQAASRDSQFQPACLAHAASSTRLQPVSRVTTAG